MPKSFFTSFCDSLRVVGETQHEWLRTKAAIVVVDHDRKRHYLVFGVAHAVIGGAVGKQRCHGGVVFEY